MTTGCRILAMLALMYALLLGWMTLAIRTESRNVHVVTVEE